MRRVKGLLSAALLGVMVLLIPSAARAGPLLDRLCHGDCPAPSVLALALLDARPGAGERLRPRPAPLLLRPEHPPGDRAELHRPQVPLPRRGAGRDPHSDAPRALSRPSAPSPRSVSSASGAPLPTSSITRRASGVPIASSTSSAAGRAGAARRRCCPSPAAPGSAPPAAEPPPTRSRRPSSPRPPPRAPGRSAAPSPSRAPRSRRRRAGR